MVSTQSDKSIVRIGRWSQRLIVLFLAVGVVYTNVNEKHRLLNWVGLVVIGSAMGAARGFWLRHLLRKQGFDPDANEIAEANEMIPSERRQP